MRSSPTPILGLRRVRLGSVSLLPVKLSTVSHISLKAVGTPWSCEEMKHNTLPLLAGSSYKHLSINGYKHSGILLEVVGRYLPLEIRLETRKWSLPSNIDGIQR